MASAIKAQMRNRLFHLSTVNKADTPSPPRIALHPLLRSCHQLRLFCLWCRQRLHTDNNLLLLTEARVDQV